MQTRDFKIIVLVSCGMLLSIAALTRAEYSIDSSVKDVLERRKNLEYVKNLIQDLDHHLDRLQKRTCYFNAGMSHSCDYKDLVSAMDEQSYWASENSPGRRKRSADSAVDVSKTSGNPVLRLLRPEMYPDSAQRRK